MWWYSNTRSTGWHPWCKGTSYCLSCLWVIYDCFCSFIFLLWDRVSLSSTGCPRTHSVDQADLKLRNVPASASQVLGLKACVTPVWQYMLIPLLGIYPEDVPTSKKETCSTMFIVALFRRAEAGKYPDAPQQRNAYKKCGTFTQWSTTRLLKRMNLWNS